MLTVQDLVNDMAQGCKPREQWRIGIEHEQFLFSARDQMPLPYDDTPGIKQVLEAFIADYGWQGVEKNGFLIEAKRDGAMITLEPGGQFELAGSPHASLHAVRAEAERFYTELTAITAKLGIGVLARGFHPTWTREDIHYMPKERYRIMAPYMEQKSRHGVDMMIRTCGAQINLDFSSEADMVRKYRVALGLQPVITALMANSHMVEGKESGYASYRSFIWTETDAQRTGVPAFIFEENMGFAAYVAYALDVPMYFIIRDGHYVNMAGQSFRAFMAGKLPGYEGQYPTLDDWHDHLTTLFPEVRLKNYLEFRGPDSTPKDQVYAMAAFWAGILYDDIALEAAYRLIASLTAADHIAIRNAVPKTGLATPVPGIGDVKTLAKAALRIAQEGLVRFEPAGARDLAPFTVKLG